jgi:hypothetical protein
MAFYGSSPIVDPDFLTYSVDVAFASATTELVITTSTKTIALKVTGNLTTDGVTIKCVYSKLKEIWRTDSTLIKFPFPATPLTDESMELSNGWNFDKTNTSGASAAKTPELVRTGGWAVVSPSTGLPTEMWASIITLGTFAANTDQAYFQQVAGGAATNVLLTNNVNQAVQIYSDPNGDGSTVDGYDYRSYFKIFVREYGKLYSQSSLADIGVSQLTYQAYRFPLANATDLAITNNDSTVSTTTPYTNVNITYLRDSSDVRYTVKGNFASATTYVAADVVKDTGNNRWYKCILGYTSTATLPSADATHWAAYEGERLIGSTYYPFTVIIDADTTVATYSNGAATRYQVYEKVQYLLRQNTDIDADATASIIGKTADSLLSFVGSTLVTAAGVYIDSFAAADTNDIEFYDAQNTKRTFPYVAALTINFGDNLKNDANAKYWAFFTTLPGAGNDFGETGAVIVQDNVGTDITGNVGGASSVAWTFNYDGNVQGGRTASTDAGITVVALGLSTGQYVKATGTIAKSKANSVSLISSLERNFANPV